MAIKDKVLELLDDNKGKYLSGEQLADTLGCTRGAVWKAVKALQENGYPISAVTNKGYSLDENTDILSLAGIKKYLDPDRQGLEIEVYKEVSSTNLVLKDYANQGVPEGRIVIAGMQTQGRGRLGRSFFSPSDSGLYMSILLRPDMAAADAVKITTAAAVSVALAVEKVSDQKPDIKWVNDIYLEDKKTCGILTEGAFNVETGKLDYAIVGIGINVCIPDGGFPDNIKDIATAIFDKQTDSINKRSILIANLLDYFMEYYKDFKSKSYVKEYIERSMIIGKTITVIEGSKTSVAKAIDIDKNCRLKVQFEDGTTKWLSSGEVSTKIHK
ncbi:MAG: biotin--[acetyl-CoA-carboxylase] ligase [Ruminococcus sp.]|nr:biotin--[acetyl-CoA-carboxylase] ligase [Ruminococcus sp.]